MLLDVLVAVVGIAAIIAANLRWLRVAQREHYLPGAVTLFMRRWWYSIPLNAVLWVIALLGLALSAVFTSALIVTMLIVLLGPIGLTPRGRTSPLAWTRRLKSLAIVAGIGQIVVIAIGAILGFTSLFVALVALTVPTFVELALVLRQGSERKNANVFVQQASERLNRVAPLVVGITGSYGKTSTKVVLDHLLSVRKATVATPASFNNRAGLSRAINEHLVPGTEIFIAEMGTYGPGEIEELCGFCPPSISVFTAIGPVHLERFGSEAAIIAAKSEIFDSAEVAVINIDDHRLADLADKVEQSGKAVWRCGTTAEKARLKAMEGDGVTSIVLDGKVIAEIGNPSVAASNIACAVAVALELELPIEAIAERLSNLPVAQHRREVRVNDSGVSVIDDTFNLNPASGRAALETLESYGGRRVVVTPGMVELGPRQNAENTTFAATAAEVATDLIVVGRSNKKALLAGAKSTPIKVQTVKTLPEAVRWVRANLVSGDAVLYANDLPDHYS